MVLWLPLDALQIKDYWTSTPTELIGVQAAAGILRRDAIPVVRMTRPAAWPVLCKTPPEWMVQFERTRADVLRMERTCLRQHGQLYKREFARCLSSDEMGERSVGSSSL